MNLLILILILVIIFGGFGYGYRSSIPTTAPTTPAALASSAMILNCVLVLALLGRL